MAETIFDGDDTTSGLPVYRTQATPVFIVNDSDNSIPTSGGGGGGAGDASAANQATQITAEQAIQAAVQVMDDWDESDRAKVNLIAGVAGVSAGAGNTDTGTLRVITAADGPMNAVLGTTAGAAVITDANGSIQQYLRGLVKLLITSGSALIGITKFQGAANIATGQVATSTTAATFVIARATRRSATLKNTDASITVYIGPATVTSSNGMPLKAGESISVDWVGLIQVIAASGTPTVAYVDVWD